MAALYRLLAHPVLLVAVVGFGVVFGLEFPGAAIRLEPAGGYYISLLKMFVLPYLFATITTGIAKIVADPNASHYINRIAILFPTLMLGTALIALACAFIIPPGGHLDLESMSALGGIVNGSGSSKAVPDAEIALFSRTVAPPVVSQTVDVLDRFIPDNIFAALSAGDSLKVLVFCIVFGAAIARDTGEGSRVLIEMFVVVQEASALVIRSLNLMLPFALFAMIASQVAATGTGPLVSMAGFLEAQFLSGLIIIAASTVVISLRAGISIPVALARMSEVLMLSVTTRNSIACMPVAIRDLTEKLGFERFGTEIVLPLGITLCRIGAVSYYVIATLFIAQIYEVHLTFGSYVTIVGLSIAAGLASSGASGPVAILLVGLAAAPLKLPIEAAIILFIAVDPIVDMIRTTVLVYGNCALSCLIIPKTSDALIAGGHAESPATAAVHGEA